MSTPRAKTNKHKKNNQESHHRSTVVATRFTKQSKGNGLANVGRRIVFTKGTSNKTQEQQQHKQKLVFAIII